MQIQKLQEICRDLKQSKNFQIFISILADVVNLHSD